jgi:Fe-S oxidoreductase
MAEKKNNKKFFEKELEDYKDQVWGCARCNWCQNQWGWNVKSAEFSEVCPAFHEYRFFPYSGMGKMHISRALLEGDFDYEDAPELAEIVYTCTTCGACEMNCQRLQDKEPLQVAETLRAQLVRDGIGPMPEHKRLIKSIKTYDNPWLQPKTQRDRWSKGIAVKNLSKEKAETLYFVGCTAALDPTLRRVAQNTARILLQAGVDLGILGKKEICCGSPAARIGDRALFLGQAQRNIEAINNLGISEVVTACAGCYRVMKFDYPEVPGISRLKGKIYHTVEYIDGLVQNGKLQFSGKLQMKVTWHDPCHLGRHCGVYDSPRKILKAIPGIEFVEMERNRDQSWCCGGGGGARTAFIEFAQKTASKRIEEARKAGVDAIVTSCPFCEQNLSDTIDRQKEEMQLFDLTDLLMKVL